MVMETAHFGNGAYVTTFRRLDRAGYWTIHVEGKVGTKSVVIAEVRCLVDASDVVRWSTITWSSTSRRILPMTRSQ